MHLTCYEINELITCIKCDMPVIYFCSILRAQVFSLSLHIHDIYHAQIAQTQLGKLCKNGKRGKWAVYI